MTLFKTIISVCLLIVNILAIKEEIRKFPDNLSFGIATAAYQIEGAWNASGKTHLHIYLILLFIFKTTH